MSFASCRGIGAASAPTTLLPGSTLRLRAVLLPVRCRGRATATSPALGVDPALLLEDLLPGIASRLKRPTTAGGARLRGPYRFEFPGGLSHPL